MKFILLIGVGALTTTWGGYALSVLWGWFIVPVFNAPHLRVPYAIGLAIVMSMLTRPTRKSEHEPEIVESIITAIIAPAVFLAFGWIVKLFV